MAHIIIINASFQRTIQQFDANGIRAYDYSRTWITFPPGQSSMSINALYLKNGAHLALEPNPETYLKHELVAHTVIGEGFILDKTKLGFLHVGNLQKITIR